MYIQHKPSATAMEIRRKPVHASERTNTPPVHRDEATKFEATTTPLLKHKASKLPRGWPTAPQAIQVSLSTVVANAAFDVLLLACSVAFLTFALIVNRYDQAPTKEHPRAMEMLLSATKYVRDAPSIRYETSLLTLA